MGYSITNQRTITQKQIDEAYKELEKMGFIEPETPEAPNLETVTAEGWTIKTDYENTVFVINPRGNKRQLFNQQADEVIDALQDGFTSAWNVIDIISEFIDYEPLETAA